MAETCKDKHCPSHGSVKTHGRAFTATVLAARAQRTVVVEWERKYHVPKFERYERRRTTLSAHNPDCINAKPGDIVRIMECRPISKTKHFTITEKLGTERLFAERAALMQEAKVKKAAAAEARKTEKTEAAQ
jgi:small subunit ribosomal protein S17